MCPTEPLIRLSVRKLVEFLLRTGSIDSRFTGFDRANEGARIHRRLQKQAGSGYAPEVLLRQDYTVEGLHYQLEGRADGIFTDEEGLLTIDEIKTTTLPAEQITIDHQPVHWAQGQVYAAIYGLQNDVDRLAVRLTYFQTDTQETIRYSRVFTAAELDAFVRELLERYTPWAKLQLQWTGQRQACLARLAFPFADYRPGQRAMAGEIFRICRDGGRLFCQAPTGIGKTMSALFPALKAMGEGCGERVFYLTARNTTQLSAEAALSMLRSRFGEGLALRCLTLTAKDKACFQDKPECTPLACPYADGYYDRILTGLWEALSQNDLSRPRLQALAQKHRLCPFEFALDLALWCDVIVGDYNYLFDPVVNLKRFFERKGEHLFLIDEAHNLPDRAREMHSAALDRSQFSLAKKALKGQRSASRLVSALRSVLRCFDGWKEDCALSPTHTVFMDKTADTLVYALQRLSPLLQEWLEEHKDHDAHSTLLELYFSARDWLRVAEAFDSHYVTQIEQTSTITVRQLCLDPSAFVDDSLALGRAAVLFSATFTPPAYYKTLCGCPDSRAVALPSPFPQQNLGLFCLSDISTRYVHRQASLPRLTQSLAAMVEARPGNYMAFFPSYAYMSQAVEQFREQYPHIPVLVQENGMTEEDRQAFLERFVPGSAAPLLGFAVMGGIFGEGIDLTGDRLIGAAVVGVGLPQVNPQQERLREYYQQHYEQGFDYAYRYPGFNKVLQAAGRVIRTPTDKGVVLLIDERFALPDYLRLMPPHWNHLLTGKSGQPLREALHAFWQQP